MAYKIMDKNKTYKESVNVETAHDKGVNSTDLLYSPYKMRTDYKKKRKLPLSTIKVFLFGTPKTYTARLQGLIEKIDWDIKNSFRKNKITTKKQV